MKVVFFYNLRFLDYCLHPYCYFYNVSANISSSLLEASYQEFRQLWKFVCIKYINLIYIYLSYDSSILDIEHSPYYIALGLPQNHKVI